MATANSRLFLILTAFPCLLQAQTTVTLTATPNPSIFGAAVTLTATVTPSTATGRVTFYSGVTVLGSKSLTSGAASISTIALPAGTQKLRAYYAGAGANAAATSNVVTQVANAQPSAGFAASALSSLYNVAAIGDFSGDGHADLITLGGSPTTTLITLLGDGAGNFSPATAVPLGASYSSPLVADFNGDGKLDLAIRGAGTLGIFLGNGDGTFQAGIVITFPNTLSSLAIADFNGDGIPDIAASDANVGVDILIGKGDGTFQTAVPYSTSSQAGTGNQANFIVAADFDGDGKVDLAAANHGSGTVTLLLGKGDGTFQAPSVIANTGPLGLATADFNADGKADLATNDGTILLGKGDGTFQTPALNAIASNPSVAVGDLNGDGNPDLLFSGGGSQFSVLYGKGDGTFQPAVTLPFNTGGASVLVGEVNGDGKTDLAFGNQAIYLGTSVSITPTAGSPQSTPINAAFPTPLQVTVKEGANPISGITVTFTAPTGGGPSAILSSLTATTNVNGVASVTATANSVTGQYTVTATALGVPTTFALTNLSASGAILTANSGTPQQTAVSTAFAIPLQVKLADSSGLASSGVTVTFSAPTTGASATLSSATAVTDANGLASVTATANGTPGKYTVTASAGSQTVNFSLTNLLSATVTLAVSANPVTYGSPLVLVASVGNATPTGRVTFFDGVNILGTKPVSSGIATLSTSLLTAGTHKLTAYYRDDPSFVAGTSNAITETVKANAAAGLVAQAPIALTSVPANAVIGDFNGDGKADFAYAAPSNVSSWWQVDLGASSAIGNIVIWNRTDCCGDRLSDFWVFVSDTPFGLLDTPSTLRTRAGTFASHQTIAPNPSVTIPVNASGRYVRVQLTNPNYLSLAEVQVFGAGGQSAVNLAQGKTATQSTMLPGNVGTGNPSASSAVDGNTNGSFYAGSVSTTDIGSPAAVNIVLGRGDGTFQTPAAYSVNAQGPLAIGDFNGDGVPDLAMFSVNPGSVSATASVTVLSGMGNGSFLPAATYPAGYVFAGPSTTAAGIAVADFNGDGKADVVAGVSVFSDSIMGTSGSSLVLLPGNGDGTFGSPTGYSGAVPPVVADFNADGIPDVAGISVSGAAPATLTPVLVLGNGNGAAQTPRNLPISGPFIAGDFNGDGKMDLVGNGAILLGNGNGTFQAPISYSGTAAVSGDFNGDGILDLVVTDASGNTSGILLGNGDGTFHQGFSIPAGAPLGVADFNGDGRADILTVSPTGVTILAGVTSLTLSVTATGGTPQSTSLGTAFPAPLQVTVMNNGVPVSGATVTFTAPTTGASATLSSPTAVTNASGVASITATANNTAGNYNVTASYNGMSASFVLTNTTFAFLVATGGTPQSTAIGTAFPTALQATVKDAVGNPVSGVTVTFTAPTTGASATLSSSTAVTNASGVASVTATANNTGGSYVVTASVGSLSTTFSLTNTGGGAGSLAASGGTPQSAAVGTAFATALQATVKDASGSPLSGVTVTFTAPTVGASATLSSATAVTNASGVASVNATANGIAGSYSVTATAGSLSATFLLTNTAGAAASITATGGTPQSTATGSAFANPLQATVRDAAGNPVGGATVTFAAPTVGASATLSATTAVTNTSGVASVTATANGTAGSYAVTATLGSLTTSFSLTNTTIQPSTLTATGGTPQTATLGSVFANPLQATLKDGSGNPLSGVTVTFTAPTVGASAILSSTTAVTNALGVASITARANSIVGSYAVTASVGSLSTTFALTNVSGSNTNLAQGKPATQSSTLAYPTAGAGSAVDGSTDGAFFDGSVTATNADTNAWWQVDLGASASIGSIVIWNRTDCCGSRLGDFWVFVSDTPFLATDTPATLSTRAGTNAYHQTTAPNPSVTIPGTVLGRYVRIQLSGTDYLSLAEVQVFGLGGSPVSNLSQGKPATQSSTLAYPTAGAGSAVDGSTDGAFFDGSVTATNADTNAWWQVDLGASASISSISIFNRTDCCGSRLSDFWVFVSDTPFLATDTPATLQNRAGTFASHQTSDPNPSTTITMTAQGRYVRVQLSGTDYLSLAEVQVFGTGGAPLSNLSQGKAASQSSTLPGVPTASALSAVDGNTDGNFYDGSVTATNLNTNAWWQVDLGTTSSVSSVVIYNRTDCCGTRLSDYWVFVSNTPFLATDSPATLQNRAGTFASHQTSAPNASTTIPMTAQGRYVRVQLSGTDYLSLAEVQVFGQ